MDMAFSSSGVRMPGAFHAEGIHHGLFRPPVASSPASSSAFLVDAATPKRKRDRDPLRALLDNEDAAADGRRLHGRWLDPDDAVCSQRAYALAGQLDTPGRPDDDSGMLGESMYSDSNYRRALGCKRPRAPDTDAVTDPGRPTPLFAPPAGPAPSTTWSAVALSTIGGVVGKVWDFCRAGAFGGFYAGGGRGYGARVGQGADASRFGCGYIYDPDDQRVSDYFPQRGEEGEGGRGGHGHSGVADDEADPDSRASTPTAPAAKRRQTGPADDLGRNWVMVKEPQLEAPLHRPPTWSRNRNRNQGPAVTSGRRISTPSSRRVSNRLDAFAAPSRAPETARPASSASFASARPRAPSPIKTAGGAVAISASTAAGAGAGGVASPSRRSAHGPDRRRPLRPSPSSPSPSSPGHGGPAHRRTHSAASAATGRADEGDASPRLDAEARKLAARRKMEERDADARIAAFNRRLQDMIRQGREALGTTVEVDGGWEDDDE